MGIHQGSLKSEMGPLNQAPKSGACSSFPHHHLSPVIPHSIMCGDAEFNCVIPGKEGEKKQRKTSSNNPICEL